MNFSKIVHLHFSLIYSLWKLSFIAQGITSCILTLKNNFFFKKEQAKKKNTCIAVTLFICFVKETMQLLVSIFISLDYSLLSLLFFFHKFLQNIEIHTELSNTPTQMKCLLRKAALCCLHTIKTEGFKCFT